MLGAEFAGLLRAARGGDAQAFGLLWRDANPAMMRYLRVVAPQADAADIACASWATVIRGLSSLDVDEEQWRSLLFATTRAGAQEQALRAALPDFGLLDGLALDLEMGERRGPTTGATEGPPEGAGAGSGPAADAGAGPAAGPADPAGEGLDDGGSVDELGRGGSVTGDRRVTQHEASADVIPGDVTRGETTPDDVTSDDVVPPDVTTGDAGPDDLARRGIEDTLAALLTLPAEDADALLLGVVGQLPDERVAALLGLPADEVARTQARALAGLGVDRELLTWSLEAPPTAVELADESVAVMTLHLVADGPLGSGPVLSTLVGDHIKDEVPVEGWQLPPLSVEPTPHLAAEDGQPAVTGSHQARAGLGAHRWGRPAGRGGRAAGARAAGAAGAAPAGGPAGSGRHQGWESRRRPAHRVLITSLLGRVGVVIVTTTAMVGAGGTALAAYNGALPEPVQQVLHDTVGAPPPPPTHGNGSRGGKATPGQGGASSSSGNGTPARGTSGPGQGVVPTPQSTAPGQTAGPGTPPGQTRKTADTPLPLTTGPTSGSNGTGAPAGQGSPSSSSSTTPSTTTTPTPTSTTPTTGSDTGTTSPSTPSSTETTTATVPGRGNGNGNGNGSGNGKGQGSSPSPASSRGSDGAAAGADLTIETVSPGDTVSTADAEPVDRRP